MLDLLLGWVWLKYVKIMQTSEDKARSVHVCFQRFMHAVLGEAVMEVAPLRSDALSRVHPRPRLLIPTSPSRILLSFRQ